MKVKERICRKLNKIKQLMLEVEEDLEEVEEEDEEDDDEEEDDEEEDAAEAQAGDLAAKIRAADVAEAKRVQALFGIGIKGKRR